MDELKGKLHQLQENQNKLADELESVIQAYEKTDLIRENQQLKKEYEENKQRFQELQQNHSKKTLENQNLRVALTEQILDEKRNILKISQQKLQTYFHDETATYKNKLSEFEGRTKGNIEQLRQKAQKHLGDEREEILTKLDEVSTDLQERLRIYRERLATEEKEVIDQTALQFDQLNSEGVSEEVIQRRIKQNQMEMKIGLNWINKVGILLLLFGVSAAAKYSYSTWLTEEMKGILFFLLGGLLIVGGEWSYRKARHVFATGLLGGGISVLYGAIFYSYFLLGIIGLISGMVLSLIVTLTAILLSIRYDSKTICSFALIGGYLPILSYVFTFGFSGNDFYVAMGYLLLLHASILWISLWRKWNVVQYLSFLLNVPSMMYLALEAPSELISIGYSVITFLLYLAITLAYPFKYKISLKIQDVILLGLNTFFSSVLLYILFYEAGLDDFNGLLALLLCLVYVGLGQFIEKVMGEEKKTIILFYGISITFAVLMIPFQFGIQWLSMGWLIEGLIFILYGSKSRIKAMEKTGWAVFLLCIGIFFLFDVMAPWLWIWQDAPSFFHLKYFAITAGLLSVMVHYLMDLRKGNRNNWGANTELIDLLKYIAVVNGWLFLIYTTHTWYDRFYSGHIHFLFYKLILFAFLTIGVAYAIIRITLIYDKVVKIISLSLYGIGIFICLFIILFVPVLQPRYIENSFLEYLALGVLLSFNMFMLVVMRDLLIRYIKQAARNIELYPVILSLVLLGNITALLIVQFQLGEYNLLFSFVYLFLAITNILYGFWRKFVYIRRLGLGLTLLATSKLFFYDLSFLGAGSKITAYFCFGIILLAISYLYQKVSSRTKEESV